MIKSKMCETKKDVLKEMRKDNHCWTEKQQKTPGKKIAKADLGELERIARIKK